MIRLVEAIGPGDSVECPGSKQRGQVVAIQYDDGEPSYKVKHKDGSSNWYESDMVVKLGKPVQSISRQAEAKDDQEKLLAKLVESLKGKSVYKTLKVISEGKAQDDSVALKGLFSLGTHVAIEVEHGHKEYRTLLPFIVEKINTIIRKEK